MANINEKAIRVYKKKFRVQTAKLYPKGIKAYFIKRDGRTQSFKTFAVFEHFGVEFSSYRHSEVIEFAVGLTETFTRGADTFTMRQLAEIATHIALVTPDQESIVYSIRTGDEYQPFYLDFTYKFFVKQIGDRFDPSENQ